MARPKTFLQRTNCNKKSAYGISIKYHHLKTDNDKDLDQDYDQDDKYQDADNDDLDDYHINKLINNDYDKFRLSETNTNTNTNTNITEYSNNNHHQQQQQQQSLNNQLANNKPELKLIRNFGNQSIKYKNVLGCGGRDYVRNKCLVVDFKWRNKSNARVSDAKVNHEYQRF